MTRAERVDFFGGDYRMFCFFLQLRVVEMAVVAQQSVLADEKSQLRNESWTYYDRIRAVVKFLCEV